jgi:environmental stress-induced protein Ves
MRIRHLTPADYRVMPWANGRGQTVELIRLLDDAGGLKLRLSVADVVEPGSFSSLPGIDRVLTLIEGDGFDLDFGGAAPGRRVLPFQPVAFSGDWATSAASLRGPSRDFNVMTPAGRSAVTVALLPRGPSMWPAIAQSGSPGTRCFFVIDGSAHVDAPGITLGARDLLLVEGNDPVAIEAPGRVLALRLDPLN